MRRFLALRAASEIENHQWPDIKDGSVGLEVGLGDLEHRVEEDDRDG
jgi:hypothetical protein